ncbi:MAG: ribonuclease P protein component [Lachnospiraceae bacterium]|jgi:ribonuclease P protein component|nr:ribonuclease P protein component [Lachnospiraceae bacterium]MEE3461758.1 ribonuclease P protein component [Lachnospiraceae bacterium]
MITAIKRNDDFLNLYHNGRSYADKYLVMYMIGNGRDHNRYGITVSKKIGNSVVRHRITRLIRESLRLNDSYVKQGFDIVIVARYNAREKKLQTVEKAYLHLCKRHDLLIEDS